MNIGASAFQRALVVVVVVVVVVLAWSIIRRRTTVRVNPRKPLPGTSEPGITAGLVARASAALVTIDEAITTAGEELGFAQAQFGLEATTAFEASLTAANASVRRAFALRQQLDDTSPENELRVRASAIEILQICAEVRSELEARSHEFDEMRDLQARASALLDDLRRQVVDAGGQVQAARLTLSGLAASYAPAALASVAGNPEQVEQLVEGIGATVNAGRTALDAGDRAAAVAAVRSGQAALAHAMGLLDAVSQAGEHLATARSRLTTGIASLNQDVVDASVLAPVDVQVQVLAASAKATVEDAQRASVGGDPLAALRAVTRAQSELAAQLAPYREQAARATAARRQLSDSLGHVTAQIGGVAEYIDAQRGAVGPEARTRLTEATRHAQRAEDLAGTDPVAALSEVRQAERLVGSAQSLAQQDAAGFDRLPRDRAGAGPGAAGGVVLGGILVDQLLRGHGHGHGHGRGFGGFGSGGC